MRVSLFTFNVAALAVLLVPTGLIYRSVSTASLLPSWVETGVLGLIAAGSTACLAAGAQLSGHRRRCSIPATTLAAVAGVFFAVAVGGLLAMAQSGVAP